MAISKKGLRRIQLNDVDYNWKLKKYKDWCPCCNQGRITLIVEKVGAGKPLLAIIHDEIYPEKRPITPKYIRGLILYALKDGWDVSAKTPKKLYFRDFQELIQEISV